MYIDLVMGLNFAVDLLLLLGAERLAGERMRFGRICCGAAVGGIYAGFCMLPGFAFLGRTVWRFVFLCIIAGVAFGLERSAIYRGIWFVVLSMALGGIALGIGRGGVNLILSAGALAALCAFAGWRPGQRRRFADVELCCGRKTITLKGLNDTGNTLTDPITGWNVMVVGAQVAMELLGLTLGQLEQPLQTLTEQVYPGLRLIPYRAVGKPSGMLLATKMDQVRIDGQVRQVIVAFAPQILQEQGYEALVGGII